MTQIEAFGQFRPFSVGFDSIFDTLQRVSVPQSNYPPYNIVKKGESYFVELAVAGFQKKDINIEVEDSSLKISVIAKSEDKFAEIIHKGISTKDFVKTFALAEFVEQYLIEGGYRYAYGKDPSGYSGAFAVFA